jgi:hypothetical protein
MDPGLRTKPCTESFDELEDQFSPFMVEEFGCDPRKSKIYEGTLFRFPLRNSEQAKNSVLRPRQAYSTEDVEELFNNFIKKAEHSILFLNNVRIIEVLVWESHANSPRLISKIVMSGSERNLKNRGLMGGELRKHLDLWSIKSKLPWRETEGSLWEMMKSIKPKVFPRITSKVRVEIFGKDNVCEGWCDWWIRDGVGLHSAWKVATNDNARHETLWPSASIAGQWYLLKNVCWTLLNYDNLISFLKTFANSACKTIKE